MSKKFLLASLLLLAAGLFQPTFACSCRESGPPCEAWGSADGVFLGRVVAITAVERPVADPVFRNYTHTSLRVRFEVEAGFRGVEGRTVELETDADFGGGCGYAFEMNRRYVVYAHKGSDNVLSTSICSRTRRAENAAEDLSFLSGVGTAPAFARIFGQLEYREDVPLLSKPRIGPLAGARVVIEGTGRSWETHSDDQGRYEISGLPGGAYEVKPQPGPGSLARFYPPSTNVKVVERACVAVNAYAQVHGRISGRLTSGNGAPVPDQTIRIMPEAVSPLDARSWELPYAITKEDGSYEFATLPSGRYVLGVNVASPPQPFRPDDAVYPRTYFPSARERADAQVIALIAGSERRDVDIVLPRPLQKRTIQGTVLWTDGKRVKGAGVSLSNPEYGAVHNQ